VKLRFNVVKLIENQKSLNIVSSYVRNAFKYRKREGKHGDGINDFRSNSTSECSRNHEESGADSKEELLRIEKDGNKNDGVCAILP